MRSHIRPILIVGLVMAAPLARAQFAVIDVGAIAQLIQQIATMRDQLTTARDQLAQAQRALQVMTGRRGMERLLAGTVRNYLPNTWLELEAAMRNANAGYGSLGAEAQAALDAIAILSAEHLFAMSAQEREQLEAARRSAAMLQITARRALANSSDRFSALQLLTDSIATADDPKAIAELQARIAVEQNMLANEQTKLDTLYQVVQAEELARRQRASELAIESMGSLRDLPPIGL